MMIDEMGEQPIEEHIPLESSDLELECQQALRIFHILPDKIEGMSGTWLGKEWAGLIDIMDIYEIDNKKDVLEYINICIAEYSKFYSEQKRGRR